MTTFAGKGSVSRLVLEKLNEGQTLEKTQLRDLLGRNSNCNFEAQVLAGLQPGEELYETILTDLKVTGLINTKLPWGGRRFLNGATTIGHSTTNVANDVDDPTVLKFLGPTTLCQGEFQMKEPSFTYADGVFTATRDKDVILNFQASIAIYDGTSKVGSTHPAPTFRFTEADDNSVTVNVDLVLVDELGGEHSQPLMTSTFWKDNIQASDTFTMRGSTRVSFTKPVQGETYTDVIYTKFFLVAYRSPYVATWGTGPNATRDKMGFIMEGSVSAPSVDTSNYLEIIEISSVGD